MNVWLLASLVLLAGGLAPAALLGSVGGPLDRLVGLELASGISTLVLLLLSQAFGASTYLIVPLVAVPLSFAGALVFTRLLAPQSEPQSEGQSEGHADEGQS